MSGSISGNISESLSRAVEEDLRSKHQNTLLSSSFSGRALGMSLMSSFPGRADHSMRLHGDDAQHDTQHVATHGECVQCEMRWEMWVWVWVWVWVGGCVYVGIC
jgi:hypothetical protein